MPKRKCIDACGAVAVKLGRCLTCHRKKRTAQAAARRKRLRVLRAAANVGHRIKGKQICSRCLKLKTLSEFDTTLPGGKGKRNQICDACLTGMYETRGSWYVRLRARAYSLNSVARQRLAREQRVPLSSVPLASLPYVCKPQDIADNLKRQNGRCCYCQVVLYAESFTLDHAQPLCRGGCHARENLVVTCCDCNHLKHTRTADEFRVFLSSYIARFQNLDLKS